MVSPTEKVSPLLWVEVTVGVPQLSADVGSIQVTTAPQLPASLLTEMSAGVPLIVGASSSVTVTVKVAVVSLPSASVAV